MVDDCAKGLGELGKQGSVQVPETVLWSVAVSSDWRELYWKLGFSTSLGCCHQKLFSGRKQSLLIGGNYIGRVLFKPWLLSPETVLWSIAVSSDWRELYWKGSVQVLVVSHRKLFYGR